MYLSSHDIPYGVSIRSSDLGTAGALLSRHSLVNHRSAFIRSYTILYALHFRRFLLHKKYLFVIWSNAAAVIFAHRNYPSGYVTYPVSPHWPWDNESASHNNVLLGRILRRWNLFKSLFLNEREEYSLREAIIMQNLETSKNY